jgi:hypothetical protein
MIGENWQFVTDELVEFENKPVELKTSGEFTNHFRGIIEYTRFDKGKPKDVNM